jgi:hypothetical protein
MLRLVEESVSTAITLDRQVTYLSAFFPFSMHGVVLRPTISMHKLYFPSLRSKYGSVAILIDS